MTTLNVPGGGFPAADVGAITSRLDAVGNRFRLAAIVRGLGRFFAVVIPVAVALIFLVGFFSLPHWLNIGLLVVVSAVCVLTYLKFVHQAIFHRPTYAEIARLVEQHAPAANVPLSNELINAILLANDLQQPVDSHRPQASTAWIPSVLHELAAATQPLALEKTVPWKQPRNAAFLAAGVILLAAVFVIAFPATFAHGLAVFSRPTAFVPVQGSIKIVSVEPGNDTLLAGQSENFIVTLDSPHQKIVPVSIALHFASGKTVTAAMSIFGSENTRYRYQLPTAAEDIDYVITAGATEAERSQSQKYHLTVLPQIHLTAFAISSIAPAYTGKEALHLNLAGKDASAAKGSVEVPLGSAVSVSVSLDMPAKDVLMDVQGGSPIDMIAGADGKTFTGMVTLRESIKYDIRVNDSANRTLQTFPAAASTDADNAGSAMQYAITATPDQPPTITVTEPAKDVDAKPGDKLELAANATDDYGLTQVSLEVAKDPEKTFHAVKTWPINLQAEGADKARPARNISIKHVLELPAADYKIGDTLRYRFVATDNRDLTKVDATLTPQSSTSQVFSITFNDNAAAAEKTTKLWDELRKELTALLDRQVALRKEAGDLTGKLAIADALKVASPIAAGQKDLRTDMAKLASTFPFEPSMKLVQKTLQVLVVEDAAGAVDRSADIALLSETKPLPALAMKLRTHQDRIIDALQALLAIAQADQKHDLVGDKAGQDMPAEAQDAWKKIAAELKKFEKQQKEVIDATASMAKKPKDDYDAKDNQKIADLAAAEDKWEKFLNDRLADMSKVAEQDQANASLLDEMVQMKVELTAAKDALQQKATQIATPLEENGLENAKALDTHIERMLMNTPDHTQWQMEEAVNQNDPAMAELPKQLQDMVGDLMDKEEDLTQDMESTGSKFADSLNKGAGWDAADGPISNMSAQGVTGNQLPKNDEIQGRSGEGREGRSSGEFVGSSAEGKGGRRTPTRMTNDPFSSGQVDDKSKEPAGGATGGGKKGGQGGEGLEGQAPPELDAAMKRMAGQQAALRNQAERINLQMHANSFTNFKLLEADVLMRKSEEALRQYRYQTAMYYQEKATEALNTAKVLASGHLNVIRDTTPEVSAKTQKDMESAMSGAMPKGYADPVKAYFEKMAGDQGTDGK